MKLNNFLLGAICLPLIVSAQEKGIEVGQNVPSAVYNYLENKIFPKENNLKDKLVILDFFATWCAPCIRALGDLQELNAMYKNNIQVIVISTESEQKLNKFFQTKKTVSHITLPFIGGDTLLKSHFPYQVISHEVWIYNGIVKAITGSEYVTAANIQQVLNGDKVNWPVKNDFTRFDLRKPLFDFSNNGYQVNNVLNYSGFSGYVQGPSPGNYIKVDSMRGIKRYNQYNQSMPVLYSLALDNFPLFNNLKRCVLEVCDSSKFFYNNERDGYLDQWQRKNWYSYEAIHSLNSNDKDFKKRLKNDLDFFFNLETSVEKRRVSCLVLKNQNVDTGIIKTKNGLNEIKLVNQNGYYRFIQSNESLYDFILFLNDDGRLLSLPLVIDESNINILIDLELEIGPNLNDVNAWRRELNKYGLNLVPEERVLEMLVITEKGYKK